MRGSLPVYGVAACHNGHSGFEMNTGEVVDRVTCPPALAAVKGAYGLYAVDDSMEPRYFHGELLYVNPAKPAQAGSFVVIQFRPEHEGGAIRAIVKRLVKRTPTKLTVEQYNPPGTFDVDADEVMSVHRIMNGDELF
ncbi:hypothetical protein A6A04_13325 [Paramagnetospirillum marisnigri]|uniref:Peptidase S24/S26A/S26B/S26C domain-containing protein n=2 Tax=Paramagnetospirillum marisnigri TaxID=1285242 RepID=A0A178MUC8_9PROT|nr:hypothetical protein A6A04_13325 [Paramagnetospirillum marisnigri]